LHRRLLRIGFVFGSTGGIGGMIAVPLMPAWLKINAVGSSHSVPAKATSKVAPTLPPVGVSTLSRGVGH
jgi:hypothetical protein